MIVNIPILGDLSRRSGILAVEQDKTMAKLRISRAVLIGLAALSTACSGGRGFHSPETVLHLVPYHLLCQPEFKKHVTEAMRTHREALERLSKLDPEKGTISDADRDTALKVQRARLRDTAERFRWMNEKDGGKGRYGEAYRSLQQEVDLYLGPEDMQGLALRMHGVDQQLTFQRLSAAASIDLGRSIRSAFAQGENWTRSAQAYAENRAVIDSLADADWRKGTTEAQEAGLNRVTMAYWVDVANSVQDLSKSITSDPFAKVFKPAAQRIAGLAAKNWRTFREMAEGDDEALCGCWQAYLDTKN